jgi:protein-S-isoprenylcysteine O-methyltransferase Ste14
MNKPDNAGVIVPPPLIYFAFFLFAVALHRLLPLPRLAGPAFRLTAALLALAWLLLTIPSIQRFHAAGTHVLPTRPATALVTTGPYRYTRNPLYLGMLFLYVAAACWSGLLWPLLLLPVLVWTMTVAVIHREERYLSRTFGAAYRNYQSRVRRWL